ncbi:MAG: YbaK/EbsC family protein, partial [Hyphomicrobiaceae bacterium]
MSEPKDAAARFEERAKAVGLKVTVRRMKESTRTAEEAAQACGCGVGQIVKSLVFRGKQSGEPYLLLVSGSNRVNEMGVAKVIGEALTRPDADYVREVTGYSIGGIPPLGHDTPLKTFIDRALTQYDIVWAAAGMPVAVFPVEPRQLAAATKAEVID